MCILISCTILSAIFLILRRTEWDIIVNVHSSSCKSPEILARFSRKLNFLNRFFEKHSNIKFHENAFSGSRVVPCRINDGRADGETDKHGECKSLFFEVLRTSLNAYGTNRITSHFLMYTLLQIVQAYQQSGSEHCRRAPSLLHNFLDPILLRRTWVFVTSLITDLAKEWRLEQVRRFSHVNSSNILFLLILHSLFPTYLLISIFLVLIHVSAFILLHHFLPS
jgi:hypothetical protein